MYKTEYSGFFAEFYDILHEKNEDTKIYPRILKEFGNDVLELGVGTGRIAIPLAKSGYNVTGIENEKAMIDILKNKEYPKSNLKVYCMDARNFKLNKKFDVVLLSCNFINHFVNSSDLFAVIKNSKEHLKDNGVIIIDCSVPDINFMVKNNNIEEVFEFTTTRGTLIKDYFCAKYDFINQVEIDTIRLEEYSGDKILRNDKINEKLTYYLPREIRSLVSMARLNIFKESGHLIDNDGKIPISEGNNEMIFYLKR